MEVVEAGSKNLEIAVMEKGTGAGLLPASLNAVCWLCMLTAFLERAHRSPSACGQRPIASTAVQAVTTSDVMPAKLSPLECRGFMICGGQREKGCLFAPHYGQLPHCRCCVMMVQSWQRSEFIECTGVGQP